MNTTDPVPFRSDALPQGMDPADAPQPAADKPALPSAPAGEPLSASQDAAAVVTRIEGCIDRISADGIEGWAMLCERPSHRCVVALREAGQVIGRTLASRFRPDLLQAGKGDGCHFFILPLAVSMLDGREHELEVVEESTGRALSPAPIRWRLAPAAPGSPAAPVLWQLPSARRAASGRRPPDGLLILFDISDLVYFIGEHANLTGIQRVQSSVVLSVLRAEPRPPANLVFLSFNARTRSWLAIPSGFLISLLEDLFLPQSQRLVSFPAEEARAGVLPGAQPFDGTGVLDTGNPSVLCVLGAAWVNPDYLPRVLMLKRRFGTRLVMTVHDLIPIFARETCDQDTARVFEEFLRRALRHVDHAACVSESTARDLRRYAGLLGLPEPPITVTRNGSSFAEFLADGDYPGAGELAQIPPRFVLFVATVEGRKNHKLVFDIWRRMLEDGDDPPHLVCVGRVGWRSEPFLRNLVESDYLSGRIILLRDVSDAQLQNLYRRCQFTLCPSLYEGWGLPVGESLAAGKVCVCSDRASLPEVAGEFGVYIDIDSFENSLRVIRGLVLDRASLTRHEEAIRAGYQPQTWQAVAERVVAACAAAAATVWPEPYPYPLVPYGKEISFAKPARDLDNCVGELLLARIVAGRSGHFLPQPLTEESFLHGEEARGDGSWAEPEPWGTWLCQGGGEIVFGLGSDEGSGSCVFLRLRGSEPNAEIELTLSVNGEPVWQGRLGPASRNLCLQVRRRTGQAGPRLLRIRAEINLSPEQHERIRGADWRLPLIGFERLVVVPEADIRTRLDILTRLV